MNRVVALMSLAGLLAFQGVSHATPSLTKEVGLRISSATPQSIIDIDSNFIRMYFIRDNFQVFSATSADGLTWIEDSSFRISTETAPSLDASSVTSCAVLPLADGSYRMLYTAKSSSASYHILSAASTDGLNWIKDPGVRYETGTSSVTLDSLRVTALSSGRWRLYYLERSSSTGVLDIFDLKTATAPNNALAWTAHRVIASSLTAGGIDVSTMTDGSIRLFY
ncbi:MAG: hypothetical protein AABZ44_05415, partial [Elusimicrobiota bacterium]